jgi:hypothetical protein
MRKDLDASPSGDRATHEPSPSVSAVPVSIASAGPWLCFHCGETFIERRCAQLHFGRDEGYAPACIIKGADGGLIKALRDAEIAADDAIQMMHAESTDAAKAYHSQRCRHTQALMAAEESGYEKGLYDARQLSASIEACEARIATLEGALREAAKWFQSFKASLENVTTSVEGLISDSGGVYGLHLNGDPAPWQELTEGGRFEDWLIALADARVTLDQYAESGFPLSATLSPEREG